MNLSGADARLREEFKGVFLRESRPATAALTLEVSLLGRRASTLNSQVKATRAPRVVRKSHVHQGDVSSTLGPHPSKATADTKRSSLTAR
jgi:hypothetical protein